MEELVKEAVINVHVAKTHLSKLLERAHGGEVIVLAKAGKPYARLMPLASEEPVERVLGRLDGQLPPSDEGVFFDALPDDELQAWEDGAIT